ncbi:MAG TPA: DUF4391 domain-containing protein [Verrucomicrobia bacterium]|nr:DUF4391 domain-containing protein [Verrucomicrobiota bacterium]
MPESTTFDRRVPKQKFYGNLAVSAALKRSFIDEIKTIWWRNKFAVDTLNLAKGTTVTEIEVFEIELANGELNEDILRQMDRLIPYHLLFVLSFADRVQAWIGYKEASAAGENAFKVSRYYHTDWIPREALRFTLSGLTLDKVYENLVRNIHAASQPAPIGRDGLRAVGEAEAAWRDDLSISENIVRDTARARLEKQIAVLEAKMRREKQLNRKMELNAELKRLRKELES